jgi:hypothetical protein
MSQADSKSNTPKLSYAEPEKFDRPPAGWFPVAVMGSGDGRKWDWVGLMVDVDPDELKHCECTFPILFFVHPNEYRPVPGRKARQCYVPVPGKHRKEDAAWEAFLDAIAATLN